MSENRPSDPSSPKKPAVPKKPVAPVPSPPLPSDFQTSQEKRTDKSTSQSTSAPKPVPSPPLPKAKPTEFKLSDGDGDGDGNGSGNGEAKATASQTEAQQQEAPATPPAPAASRPPRTQRLRASSGGSPMRTPAAPPRSAAKPSPVEELPPVGFFEGDWRAWLDKAEPAAQWMFRVGAFFSALTLAFILYAVFVGKIGQPGTPAPMVGLLKQAAFTFHWAIFLLALSLILLAFDASVIGITLLLLGVLIHLGVPWFFANHVGRTNATLAVVNGLSGTGVWLIVLGVFKAAIDLMQWIMTLPERMKQRASVGAGDKSEAAQQRVARDANVFSPCWKLPYCRETIRKQCPAFLAKQTCWKFRRGCYCDEEMIARIIRGESLEVIKAPTRLSRTRKPPCHRCHIYLEHQGHKFKALSPLTLPATAIIMYIVWPHWTRAFEAFSSSPIWDMFSFNPKSITPDAIATTEVTSGGLPPEQVMSAATVLFGVLLGFFVLIYVAKFIEWFVYKAKL